jgi:hypothetical protein
MAKQLVEWLIDYNRDQARLFEEQHDSRMLYRIDHPTEISVMKCMDGRVHIPFMCEIPMGMVKPYRNIGGIFNAGWPAFQHRLNDDIAYAISKRRRNLFLATFHYSKGDDHRGCAGHGYDTDKAKASTISLVADLSDIFKGIPQQVQIIPAAVETDEESLVLFDRAGGRSVSVADMKDTSPESFQKALGELYPDMSDEIARDFLPLLLGNARHVGEIRRNHRQPDDLEHKERILAIGQGFSWMHERNLALIVNDVDPQLDDIIAKAAGIILGNLKAKRIPDSGALLFTSVSYTEGGFQKKEAEYRSRYLRQLALETIRAKHSEAADFFHPLASVVDYRTRKLEILE